jgi:hypothetical protein
MRRWLGAAAVVGLILAGCGEDAAKPLPASVARLDPCDLLTSQEQTDLHLKVNDRTNDDHRRSCTFFGTDIGDSPGSTGIDSLEIVIREGREPNRVADAKRIAETYQRERKAKLTTTTIAGRAVYQVGPADPIGCRLLLDVNATSSVEVAPVMSGQAPNCMQPDLARLVSAKLPAPDPKPARADHERPVDILGLDPCTLISVQRRTALGLGNGTFDTKVTPSCQYFTNASGVGMITSVSVTLWTSGAHKPDDKETAVRHVNGRLAYEVREATGPGPGATSICDYNLEVTRATSVQVSAWVLGAESLDVACGHAADLATDIEPRLPLIVV